MEAEGIGSCRPAKPKNSKGILETDEGMTPDENPNLHKGEKKFARSGNMWMV